MEAKKLKTMDDLLEYNGDRVELINGEIIKRPMARAEHALLQSSISDEIIAFKREKGPEGWWILSEISVRYNEHQCPCHDLAGWRKKNMPNRPTGVMVQTPDWVCEITSPGHERKDVFNNFMLLQRYKVPFYWLISPEDKTLIVYQFVDETYRVVFSLEYKGEEDSQYKIPPFESTDFDLGYVFGT